MPGYRIAEARGAKGLTQAALAKLVGTSQQQVARWESGEGDVKASVAIELAHALDVGVAWLLGVDEANAFPAPLTPQERAIVLRYRNMSDEGRRLMDESSRMYFEMFPNEEITASETSSMSSTRGERSA